MKIKSFGIAGILFILLGTAALVHPRFFLPASTQVSNTGNQRIIVETRRAGHVPMWIAIFWLVAGCGLVYLSTVETSHIDKRK